MAGLSGGEPRGSRKVNAGAGGRKPECTAQGAGEHESTRVSQFLGLVNDSVD